MPVGVGKAVRLAPCACVQGYCLDLFFSQGNVTAHRCGAEAPMRQWAATPLTLAGIPKTPDAAAGAPLTVGPTAPSTMRQQLAYPQHSRS